MSRPISARKFTAENPTLVAKLRSLEGLLLAEISASIGVTDDTARKYCKALGIKYKRAMRQPRDPALPPRDVRRGYVWSAPVRYASVWDYAQGVTV